jgi:FtsZ-binding cell division protein ZapB
MSQELIERLKEESQDNPDDYRYQAADAIEALQVEVSTVERYNREQARQAQEPADVESLVDVAYKAWQDRTTFDLGKVRSGFRAAVGAPKQAK